jgi:transposase-like protein
VVEMMEGYGLSMAYTTIMQWIHSMLGLKSLPTAKSILSGMEAMYMMKKDNFLYRTSLSKVIHQLFGMVA